MGLMAPAYIFLGIGCVVLVITIVISLAFQ